MPTFVRVDAGVPSGSTLPTLTPPTSEEKAIWLISSLKGWWEADAGWFKNTESAGTWRWLDRKNNIEMFPKGSKAPNLIPAAVNGQAALQFGHGDGLSQGNLNGALDCNESGMVSGIGYTFFMVYSVDQAGTGGAMFGNRRDGGSGAAFMPRVVTSDDTMRIHHQTPATELTISGGCPTTTDFVTDCWKYSPTADTITVRRDGGDLGSATGITTELSNDTGSRFLVLGGIGASTISQAFSGHIAAFLAFNVPITSDQTTLVEEYLQGKYGTW